MSTFSKCSTEPERLKFLIFRIFLVVLAAMSMFVQADEIPEEEYPSEDVCLKFSQNPGVGGLTNEFPGVIRYSDPPSAWIDIIVSSNKYWIVAKGTNEYGLTRGKLQFSITVEPEEICTAVTTYEYHCNWDETADDRCCEAGVEPERYCKKLEVGTEAFHGTLLGEMPDSDVFYFEPDGKTGFCIEIEAHSNIVIESSIDNSAWSTLSNAVQLRDNHDEPIEKARIYLTNDFTAAGLVFVRLSKSVSQPGNARPYSLCLSGVTPLILVHGINSHPTHEEDTKISFDDIYAKTPVWNDFKPALTFLFPWDSSEFEYLLYCSSSSAHVTLSEFTTRKCKNWYLPPIIIAHSMGGLLSTRQMAEDPGFSRKIAGIICLGSPFLGSDLGNIGYKLGDIAEFCINTSHKNFQHLSRGTKYVIERMNLMPERLKNIPAYCVGSEAKYKSFFLHELKLSYFNDIPIENNASLGLTLITGSGDTIVNASSSNLEAALDWNQIGYLKIPYIHTEMNTIKLKDAEQSDYENLYKIIRKVLNENHE